MLEILSPSTPAGGALQAAAAHLSGALSGAAAVPANARGYLSFMLAGQSLVADLAPIREVTVLGEILKIAHLPDFVWGVTDIRGEAVPIIDLRARFHLPAGDQSFALGPTHKVAIILDWADGAARRVIGVLVDSVQDVVFFEDAALSALPDMPFAEAAPYLSGLARAEGGWLVRVDLQRLLSASELAAAAQAKH
jgi:purine-binding chemotaxis protein CheW